MHKIENKAMLEFLRANDEAAHFDACHNIVNAGHPTSAIKSIEFYTDEKDTPKVERVEFTSYVFGELSVRFYTTSPVLIDAACERIKLVQPEYERVYVETRTELDLSDNTVIRRHFDVPTVYEGALGIFGLRSVDNIPVPDIPKGIDIRVAADEELEYVKTLDIPMWGGIPMLLARAFVPETDFLYLLYSNGEISAMLCANREYSNFQSVMTVFTRDDLRSRGFGTMITTFFVRHCLENGLVPHYGTAVSPESEKTALKSGFVEMERYHGFDIAVKS